MGSRSRSSSFSHSSSSRSRSRSFTSPERKRGEDSGQRQYSRQGRTGTRVHIGSLAMATSTRELREEFRRFGDILDLWMARTQPCFAFVVFRHKEDALKAIKRMDGETLHSRRIRVTMARPRTKGTRSGAFNPQLRCYQCGKRGHFSRDCRAHQWSPARNSGRYRREELDRRHFSHSSSHRF